MDAESFFVSILTIVAPIISKQELQDARLRNNFGIRKNSLVNVRLKFLPHEY